MQLAALILNNFKILIRGIEEKYKLSVTKPDGMLLSLFFNDDACSLFTILINFVFIHSVSPKVYFSKNGWQLEFLWKWKFELKNKNFSQIDISQDFKKQISLNAHNVDSLTLQCFPTRNFDLDRLYRKIGKQSRMMQLT